MYLYELQYYFFINIIDCDSSPDCGLLWGGKYEIKVE